tara:strand:- start:1582 stop:2007 length:426 start_codon:yes stop_codon:yes gene_type:complete
MTSELTGALRAFRDPRNERQLQLLERSLTSCDPKNLSPTEQRAMLGVFERFPEEDGFGTFWTILHTLEASLGYEPLLMQSAHKHPARFNMLMIQRLLAAGVAEVEGSSLLGVLIEVSQNPLAAAEVKADVSHFLKSQGSGQ